MPASHKVTQVTIPDRAGTTKAWFEGLLEKKGTVKWIEPFLQQEQLYPAEEDSLGDEQEWDNSEVGRLPEEDGNLPTQEAEIDWQIHLSKVAALMETGMDTQKRQKRRTCITCGRRGARKWKT